MLGVGKHSFVKLVLAFLYHFDSFIGMSNKDGPLFLLLAFVIGVPTPYNHK